MSALRAEGKYFRVLRVFCQGSIPQKHWNLIYANDVVHDYDLKFDGYWVSGNEHLLPNYPGIYCVYSCKDNFSIQQDRVFDQATLHWSSREHK